MVKQQEEIINDRHDSFFATAWLTTTKPAKITHENKQFFLVINVHLTVPSFTPRSFEQQKVLLRDYELLLCVFPIRPREGKGKLRFCMQLDAK